MSIFTEEDERLIRENALARYHETKYIPFHDTIAHFLHDAHVISWITLNYWHVEVGRDGEWRLA